MNYKTYAEAKIANPACEIVTTGKNWIYDKELTGTFQPRVTEGRSHAINDYSWVICNPADYCSTLKEFLEAGLELVEGDKFIGIHGNLIKVKEVVMSDTPNESDNDRYILSAEALDGGCKIEFIEHKAEPWTVYSNATPLSELSDEQAAQLFNAWRKGGEVEFDSDCGSWLCADDYLWIGGYVYRIKQRSERELFIENSSRIMHSVEGDGLINDITLGALYDNGARYTDLTQYFGENI